MTEPFETYLPAAGKRPLLLVEDNPMDLDLTVQAFADSGFASPIVACRDGEDALRYVSLHGAEGDPALPLMVLLDLRLPNLDGLDVLRALREHAVWRRIPVVVLTTSRESEDVKRAYELGANSYIVKPVSFDAFVDVAKQIRVYWLSTNEPPFPGDE
jgi:CheY-like chemotaxis protein